MIALVTTLIASTSRDAAARPLSRTYVSAQHRFTVKLPLGWERVAPTSPNDFAELRFRHLNPVVNGFYQVYEGAPFNDPQAWYEDARRRYDQAARVLGGVRSIHFSDLAVATMGGRAAYSFGFVLSFAQGPPVANHVVFLMRHSGTRVDVHEIMLTGTVAAMIASKNDIDALLASVSFTP